MKSYRSKYSLPLEIELQSLSRSKKSTFQAKKALQATWTGMRWIYRTIMGFLNRNPRIKRLPWLRLATLCFVGFFLFGKGVDIQWGIGDVKKSIQPISEDRSVAPVEPETIQAGNVHEFIDRFSKTA
ncbi:MAG: hypothetical protein HKN16_00980, partial [Saprospiraceae bacterium]|nr:hypothetical protein [Saprospiraceae bacterium]